MKNGLFLSLIAISLLLTSCASIVSGGSPKIMLVGQSSEPVTIKTSKLTYFNVYLPTEVKVNRHRLDGQHISITSENFTYQDIVLEKSVNKLAFCNILAGGFIGWGVDLATNAVVVPKQKVFTVSGTPKNTNTQTPEVINTQNNTIADNQHETFTESEESVTELADMTVSSKTLKDNASKIEGTYVGTGSLSQNNSVIESYNGISVTIKKSRKDVVLVNVIESNGEKFFDSDEEYTVTKLSDGRYQLSLSNIKSAKITIDTRNNLVYIHPRVNIEGDIYSLSIKAKKQ